MESWGLELMKRDYTILSIETSLDDTCAAVTRDNKVISNVVASQVKFHEEFGGTVPHIAKRKHQEWIDKTIEEALMRANIENPEKQLDAIAVTYGPGLAPSLEVGIDKARSLSVDWKIPLIAVNHMEGHLLSSFAMNSKGNGPFSKESSKYPALGFLISGGHTQLVLMEKMGKYLLLGETLDDAAGEAYDKVARMLKLGYPGGPILSEIAKEGEIKYELPEPMKGRNDLNFSFSGLKTAALYLLRDLKPDYSRQFCADFAASFEDAVLKMLVRRFEKAVVEYQPKMVLLGGAVISNVAIRKVVRTIARKYKVKVYVPYSKKLYTDNAAMIGVCAWYMARSGMFWKNTDSLDRKPNLSFLRADK